MIGSMRVGFVRAVDAFVDVLDLGVLGFEVVEPAVTGRPGYHPSVLLKHCICGFLNRVQSSSPTGEGGATEPPSHLVHPAARA